MLKAFRSSQHPITTMSSNDNSLTRENNGSNNLKKLNAFYICKIEGNPKFGGVIFHILMVPHSPLIHLGLKMQASLVDLASSLLWPTAYRFITHIYANIR